MSRCWEDERFLFNPHTGETHILNQLSWQLLSACAGAPQAESALCRMLTDQPEMIEGQALDDSLQLHLDHLFQLGLIAPVASHESS